MSSTVTRRGFLAAGAALAGCRRKAKGFPGYLFVANEEGRSLAAVDLDAFALAGQIALEAGPNCVLAHPKRRAVYALTPQTGAVYEIDTPALRVRRKARPAGPALSMRMAGDALWLLCRESRELVRVSLESLRVSGRIALAGTPGEFELDHAGRFAAISFPGERMVALCDLSAGNVAFTVPAGSDPRIAGFRLDDKYLLTADRAGRSVTIADVKAGKTVVQLPLPLEPADFCFHPNGGELYVTGPGMDAVVIIWPYSTEVGETILAGRAPGSMAVLSNPPLQLLFVSNPEGGDITVLDIDTRKLVVVVHAGIEPRQILFTPDNQYALVLDPGSGNLAVIRIAAFTSGPEAGWARRYKRGPLFMLVPVGQKPVSAAVVST